MCLLLCSGTPQGEHQPSVGIAVVVLELAANDAEPHIAAHRHGVAGQAACRWRQRTSLIFTCLALVPSLLLAFLSNHFINAPTPLSASELSLLFSHPVIFSSPEPALVPVL